MTVKDERLSLFLMLGQLAKRAVEKNPELVPEDSLLISPRYDLSQVLPQQVREASNASEAFKLFYVFENFLRDLVLDVLAAPDSENWWSKVPKNIQDDVKAEEEKDEMKSWMSLGTRDKLSLTTYPQLLAIIDGCWTLGFEGVIRDKALIQEARHIAHLRNATCHMTVIPTEEVERIKQVMRDWFRVGSP